MAKKKKRKRTLFEQRFQTQTNRFVMKFNDFFVENRKSSNENKIFRRDFVFVRRIDEKFLIDKLVDFLSQRNQREKLIGEQRNLKKAKNFPIFEIASLFLRIARDSFEFPQNSTTKRSEAIELKVAREFLEKIANSSFLSRTKNKKSFKETRTHRLEGREKFFVRRKFEVGSFLHEKTTERCATEFCF